MLDVGACHREQFIAICYQDSAFCGCFLRKLYCKRNAKVIHNQAGIDLLPEKIRLLFMIFVYLSVKKRLVVMSNSSSSSGSSLRYEERILLGEEGAFTRKT